MPGDPFKTKPNPAKSLGSNVTKGAGKKSKPKVNPGPGYKVKSPMTTLTGGGARSGKNMQGLIGQPSVSKTPHIQGRSQMKKAVTDKGAWTPSGKKAKGNLF